MYFSTSFANFYDIFSPNLTEKVASQNPHKITVTEHHLEFLSLKGGCTGSSESTLVKMPHCWKSHVTAQL